MEEDQIVDLCVFGCIGAVTLRHKVERRCPRLHITYSRPADTQRSSCVDVTVHIQFVRRRGVVDTDMIYNGEIGAFEGIRFVESARAPLFANASNGSGSAGTIDVYGTLVMGRQALAKAHSITDGNGPLPKIVRGPITDSLERFRPIGWYWLGGYGRFREASLRRVESSSSIGANS